uniref:Uncharacterized protein n=1 Tax=Oryza punctata TaxID=4537 RepID=A0A0E0JU79_ORYPU
MAGGGLGLDGLGRGSKEAQREAIKEGNLLLPPIPPRRETSASSRSTNPPRHSHRPLERVVFLFLLPLAVASAKADCHVSIDSNGLLLKRTIW